MSALRYIVQKEFRQIRRNRIMIPMLTIMPIIQLIVLSYAANFDVKHLQLAIIDKDQSVSSRALIRHFTANGYFDLQGNYFSEKDAFTQTEKDNVDVILDIPYGFDRSLHNDQPANIQLLVNAVNSQKAGVAGSYCQQIISNFNQDEINKLSPGKDLRPMNYKIREAYWYNPELNYKLFMVPGILAVLVTMLTAFLSAINIIREKEIGTIEQINVTPISKAEFIIGKLVPFWIIGMFLLGFGLTVAYVIFDVTVQGSILLLFAFCAIYVIAILGIGMLISTVTETQQQAMFVTWFFMVIFILLSGLFTPIDSIPPWAKMLNIINPIKYFVAVMRMVMLKASGWNDVLPYFGIMGIFAVVTNSLAILNYRKTNQ